ncbi:sugar phosphate nucleotidyltransferase [Clostridium sp. Marseille-P2415]|uniref:sugar phosphate nucleotidyltransferase n=1 Tax=Clostridium sp. Marseille-P2415 TaxID=1805471 RepID=UPI000988398E|nr:sugar phosphate nucleotidyltransferase [Clostridium sp. Marseille-P2415]
MDRNVIICRSILENPAVTQRELSQELNVSLGTANNLVKECMEKELITTGKVNCSYELLPAGRMLLSQNKVDGALIIAAGFGSRFVPLTFETPKGLLEVFGERMIERQIRQLHEAGITDITIVVGYLKEKFEYLMDKYQVKLLYNPEYSHKNTLTTIYHAREVLRGKNMYVLSSDNWMRHNMYHAYEGGAWYSSSYMEGETSEWCLDYNKKGRILNVSVGGRDKWVMYGPAFFSKSFSEQFLTVLEGYYKLPGTEQFYWENVYMDMLSGEAAGRLPDVPEAGREIDMFINRRPADEVYEFENLEELRRFDIKYQHHSDNEAMELVSKVFHVKESEITEIRCLKAGMTNKSFLFKVKDRHYICRIPGPGTEALINRKQEKAVYDALTGFDISEKVIYFNGETGYKIAEFYEGAHNADPRSQEEMEKCMAVVRRFHKSGLKVGHTFDFKERIDFYEKLCKSHGDILFEDYSQVRGHMTELLNKLESFGHEKVLSHLDTVVDNFLMLPNGDVRLIDWEYAGMCDPLADIAMCAIYSYYSKEETDHLIEVYLEREPTGEERFTIYAYMALGGFLWSLWAIYKASLGDEFGEYTIIMYRYAKNYYKKCCKIANIR